MKIVELYKTPHEVLDIAWSGQRQYLRDQGVTVLAHNVSGMPSHATKDLLKVMPDPDAWLLRDLEFLKYDLSGTVYLDLSTPCALGPTSPWRTKLQKVRRVFGYSALMENSVRDAGMGRVTTLPGPYIEPFDSPLPERMTVAVLKTSADAQRVLFELLQFRASKNFDWDVVSPIQARGSTLVGSNLDAADAATLILAPTDNGGDLGTPHLGAILALASKKALATSRNDAVSTMGFPAGTFINVTKYSARSYVGAIELFLRGSKTFLEWPHKAKTDYADLPKRIVRDLTALGVS